MKIELEKLPIKTMVNFNGGEKELSANMFIDDAGNKIFLGKLVPGASIGMHKHETSCEIIYVLKGKGKVLYNDTEESVVEGDCHYCPKGHSHSLINNSDEDLEFFAVVPIQ
ncbi:MAG: cupin domain-containing protein [Bacilli bacterium]|nr:cupin domain-containing protein [Bacilli bacterium]